jgi:hypothetical protein
LASSCRLVVVLGRVEVMAVARDVLAGWLEVWAIAHRTRRTPKADSRQQTHDILLIRYLRKRQISLVNFHTANGLWPDHLMHPATKKN